MSLKEMFEEVQESINNYDREVAINKLKDIANDYDKYDYVDNFIHTDEIDDFVQRRLTSSGWQGVSCCLSDIKYLNDEYYYIDGYENLEEVTIDTIKAIFSDLKRDLESELEEEEEEEEEE